MAEKEKTNILETPEEEAKARAEIAAEEFPEADHQEAASVATSPADDDADLEPKGDTDEDLKAKEEADAAAQAATDAAKKAEEEKPVPDAEREELLAGMSPAARTAYEGQEKELEVLKTAGNAGEERLKQVENRLGSITNFLQNQKDEAKKAEAEKEKAPTEEEIAAAAESEEAWKELVEEYPEFTSGISGKLSPLEKRLEILEGTLADTAENAGNAEEVADLKLVINQLTVAVKHSDWDEIRSSEDFAAWIVIQSPEIIEQYKSLDPADAVAVLESFKEREGAEKEKHKPSKTAAEIAQEKKDRLKASEALDRSGSARASKKPVEEMTDEEYRKEAAKDAFPDS